MKNSQDSQDIKPNLGTSKTDQKKENPVSDAGSVSVSSNDNRKVSREGIELVTPNVLLMVQNLIERFLQLYMNREEVVKILLNRARINPSFTTLVWQKLEEENSEFFRAYYIRLKLKKQIILFNHLLEHQYHLMRYTVPPPKVPLAPMHNGMHPPPNNMPMGYPIMQHPAIPAPGQPHIVDPMVYPAPGCHIVNGVPAPGNFHVMRMNSGNDVMMDASTTEISPVMPPNHAMSSDMLVSPTSVASSGHFPFTTSEISGMGVDTSVLDSAFTADNGVGNSQDSLRSLAQIPWNFSLSDLSADLSNLGDLGALGSYPGSPFFPSDSDILLDSPHQDGIVEEFFVDSDSVLGQCPPSDEDKS